MHRRSQHALTDRESGCYETLSFWAGKGQAALPFFGFMACLGVVRAILRK